MYTFSTYSIKPLNKGTQLKLTEDIRSILHTDDIAETPDGIEVEEDSEAIAIEDLCEKAKKLAACLKDTPFAMEGMIDATSGAGEEMVFKIEVADGKLICKATGWYVFTSKDSYDDYEDFCDQCGDDVMSEEEFDEFEDDMYILNSGDGPVVTEDELEYEVVAEETL